MKLKHKLIHIPFGSGCIFPETQSHPGHYGSRNTTRSHAILVEKLFQLVNCYYYKILIILSFQIKAKRRQLLEAFDKYLVNKTIKME